MPESAVVVAIVAVSVAIPLVVVFFAVRSMRRATGRIRNAVAGSAVVQSIAETGTTITTPSIGPDAPVYRIGLVVSPPAGSPYPVETTQAVPRIHVPFFRPGMAVPVDIDPKDPEVVKVSWERLGGGGLPGVTGVAGGEGGPNLRFVDNRPVDGVDDVMQAVRSGSIPTHKASAAALLATGTRGTAEVTTAMPLGKRARDVFPDIDPSMADDPLWLFTVAVQVPGEASFPAVFGHRVPVARVSAVGPGMIVPVAVNLADRNNQVAIDWDALPA